jgi:hypothetical protein
MTPSGIEPATFQFVAQYLNHCDTAVSPYRSNYGFVQTCKIKKEFLRRRGGGEGGGIRLIFY